ncbi:DUF262 domain-containing protein [Breoghania sp.]|uniref:DUF262 domain-containing protein n=1 Tax=Breoghania sp. TaxID=2065378 RepID=UPI0029CA6E58|nr:DUF262 domain-containing protein [Breoghania sp.]
MTADEDLGVDQTEEGDLEADSYITYDIATYPSDLTLRVLKDMWASNNITIPRFQRNFVWTIKQSSLLIESFLLGLPVPQAFFFIDDKNDNLVIDGQQRITSIIYYLDGYFGDENYQGRRQVFRLSGLNEKSPFFNKRFTDLEEKDQNKLLNSVLRVVNIRQMSPRNSDTAAFHIFERLNTGGTPLKPQEIRNCVFNGAIVDKLNELNKNPNWRLIIGKKTLDKHQRDVEILLRVFAMYERLNKYEKPMKEFLNQTMGQNKDASSLVFVNFSDNFPIICKKIIEHFGEKPFHIRGPINLAALDSVMAECLRHPKNDFGKANLKYKLLLSDEAYRESIFFNTSDLSTVKQRMTSVRALFQ